MSNRNEYGGNMQQVDSCFMVTGSRVQTLIEVFRAINVIADEVRIFFKPEGLEYSGMDPSHILMADLNLPANFFDTYRFSAPMAITISLKNLIKQLRGVGKNDELTASIEDGRLLLKVLDYLKKGTKPRAVEKRVPLLEDPGDETPKPKIFFKARARIIAESLKETLKDMVLVADNMSILIDGEILHIGAHDNNFSADSEYERGADDLLDIRAEEPSLSAFTTEYISRILNAVSKLSEVVEISVSNNTPIKISAELTKGVLDFYAAPCLNRDGSSLGNLGAESVTWDPKPILVYQKGDTPAIEALAIKVPELAPHLCEYPGCAAEIPEAEGVRLEDGETILCAEHAEIVEAEIPIPPEDPEPVPVDVEDPGADELPAEAPQKTVIEELPQAPIDDWTLHSARIQYYRNNPGVYEAPTPEQLQPYLEGVA